MTQISAELNTQAKTLKDLTQAALQEAKGKGAEGAKVSTSATFQRRMVVENKQFSLANSLQSQRLGLAVHKDQKKGSATSNIATGAAVKEMVDEAMALASFSVADPNLTLATTDQAPTASPLSFMYDDSLADLSLEEIKEVLSELLGTLTADTRVALDRLDCTLDVTWHALMNSNGVSQEEKQTMLNWTMIGMAVEGDQVSNFDYTGGFSFDKGSVLGRAKADVDKFIKRVVGNLNPKKAPSYKGLVVLSPRAVRSLLANVIAYQSSGRQLMDGKSRWADKEGGTVCSELISLHDLPHDKSYAGATCYDGDGLPTHNRKIVHEGTLCEFLYDCYSAKKLGKASNAASGAPFSTVLLGGSTPKEELLKARGEILLVDRFSGNCDPFKGDFSGVAKSSHLYKNGEDVGAVTETMIAGNAFDLLKSVQAVSQETQLDGGSFQSPYILCDGVSVTGS